MTDTTLSRSSSTGWGRLAPTLTALGIVAALLAVLGIGFMLGKRLTATESEVVELPSRPVQSLARTAPVNAPVAKANLPNADDGVGKVTPGQPAPAFTLQTPDGQTLKLSDLKGKPVLLNFWATWCAPCLIEMPALEQTYRKYKDQGLVVLGVNQAESPERVAQYMKTWGLSFPTVLDPDTAVAQQYRVTGYPTTWLIDRDGVARQLRRGAFGNADQIERLLADVLSQ